MRVGTSFPKNDVSNRTGQDGMGRDRTGQDQTGQDRTRQDGTGQDQLCKLGGISQNRERDEMSFPKNQRCNVIFQKNG